MAQTNIAASIHRSRAFDFVYCIRPVYYFSRICGFMPYTVIHDLNCKIQRPKIRVYDLIWFILSIFCQILSLVFYFETRVILSSFAILTESDAIIIAMRTIFNIFAITMDMCHRYKFIEILKKINNFDEDVRHHLNKISNFRWSFLTIFCLFLVKI